MCARGVARRLTAWTMLVLYGLIASGLPLPLAAPAPGSAAARRLAAKDRSQPFPCMDKPCGCDSAERCFTNCCCHTPAETLAWARARRIEPAVIAALSRRVAAAAPAPSAGDCCGSKAASRSCCAEAEPSCCRDAGLADATPDARPPAAETAERIAAATPPAAPPGDEFPAERTVVLRAMLACGGIAGGLLTAALGGGLPPPRVDFSPGEGPRQDVLCRDERPCRRPSEPAVPPPRGG